MPNAHRVRQPECFDRFHCIGADCEDSCCAGWGIPVDWETWEKYSKIPTQQIANAALGSLVEINSAGTSANDYARFRMEETGCPAFQQGWCSIQTTLGESYIPDLCSTYPRVLTVLGGVMEKSLHLSCPEAARLVLGNPDAMIFYERTEAETPHRAGSVARVDGDPDQRLHAVRAIIIETIRERSLPLWQRIVSLTFAIGKLAGVDTVRAVSVLEDHIRDLRNGLYQEALASEKGDPVFQLETILELVVARLGSDYTDPRFVECYTDFMHGLAWTADSTMEELARRYSFSSQRFLLPFLQRHEHVLENYLINYIFRTVFPYRRKLPDQKFAIDSGKESLSNAVLLLSVHYATIRALLTGMAAVYKDNLSMDHAVKLVQSHSKAFLHSTSFDEMATAYFAKQAGGPVNRIAALVMD